MAYIKIMCEKKLPIFFPIGFFKYEKNSIYHTQKDQLNGAH